MYQSTIVWVGLLFAVILIVAQPFMAAEEWVRS